MNHIELFSGCGGLSLGLAQSGFELTMANELSPMAAESFAYNFFNENLKELAENNQMPTKTLWLNSNYDSLDLRLRENPFTYPNIDQNGTSDLPNNWNNLNGKLVVGSIIELNRLLDKTPELLNKLKNAFDSDHGLDLVSGGPPCQSFSMAGLREFNNEKNTLPWEFAKFVKHTQPKIAMLENVTGILRPFKDADGKRVHAWYEVAKAFSSIGYIPLCLHINARYVGIAQNRPRFIMIAIRHDYYQTIKPSLDQHSANTKLFEQSEEFYCLIKENGEELPFGHLNYFDVTTPAHLKLFKDSFLASLVDGDEISVKEAIDDLKQNHPSKQSSFIRKLNTSFDVLSKQDKLFNHEFRRNSDVVKRRFRLYQILQNINNRAITKAIFAILRGDSSSLEDSVWNVCHQYDYLQTNGKLESFKVKEDFVQYLHEHPTKKQTQKALVANSPAPATLSIPDDSCHYDEHELRVLTVREMARIQSFPDNFVFRSKVTTGGQMRKFEVPQYTQVGNAVPPLLGLKLGKCISKLLK